MSITEFVILKVEKLSLDLDEVSLAFMSTSFIDLVCECFFEFSLLLCRRKNLSYS